MNPDWQPTLLGATLLLRPMAESDLEALFAAASDPLIWELHPDRHRYTRERFELYFRSGMESGGALVIIDRGLGRLIGGSRFYNVGPSYVEIGYSFLARDYWGGQTNRELKTLMLTHAFQHVRDVYFVVGKDNLRSQRAMFKIGGIKIPDTGQVPLPKDLSNSVVFKITRDCSQSPSAP